MRNALHKGKTSCTVCVLHGMKLNTYVAHWSVHLDGELLTLVPALVGVETGVAVVEGVGILAAAEAPGILAAAEVVEILVAVVGVDSLVAAEEDTLVVVVGTPVAVEGSLVQGGTVVVVDNLKKHSRTYSVYLGYASAPFQTQNMSV